MGKEQMPFERGKEDQPNILLRPHTVMQAMEKLAKKNLPPEQKEASTKPRRHKSTGMFPKEFDQAKKDELEKLQRDVRESGYNDEY